MFLADFNFNFFCYFVFIYSFWWKPKVIHKKKGMKLFQETLINDDDILVGGIS